MPIDLNDADVKAAIKAEADKLAAEKIEAETGGLKSKNTELLDEVKALKKKFEGIDPEEHKRLKGEKREKEDKESDPVQLRKRIEEEFTPKLTDAEKRAAEAEAKLAANTIDSQLTAALAEAGVAKEFLRAVKADLGSSRKVEVTDNGVIVDGKPVGDFVKAWAQTDGKAFIAAPDNAGGGGKGGGGGGASTKKASEMNAAEKAEFIREKGSQAYREKVDNEQKAQ